jgi:hypothetical protein
MERNPRGRAEAVCGQGVKVVRTVEEVCRDPDVELVREITYIRLNEAGIRDGEG